MWLLHSMQLKLEAFFDAAIPPYAILSHRWGSDEISFQELQIVTEDVADEVVADLVDARFAKIQKTRELARRRRISWVWIDTCCIDKKSSAELSEAINSMFRWYQRAEVCFVYMADLVVAVVAEQGIEDPSALAQRTGMNTAANFRASDWFTRGWTLQELLAPHRVNFYNREWAYVGNRNSLATQIAQTTGINQRCLIYPGLLYATSVAEKMSWASKRQTTRTEDMAYCLLGLFGVNMPLLYGEGERAFMRLQLEIVRSSEDESIFAWRRSHPKKPFEARQQRDFRRATREKGSLEGADFKPRFQLHSGLLAQEPLDFIHSGCIKWKRKVKFARRWPYEMTNQGLRFYVDAYPSEIQDLTHMGDSFVVVLNCYTEEQQGDEPITIVFSKENDGHDQYWRRRNCMEFDGKLEVTAVQKDEEKKAPAAALPVADTGEEKTQMAFFIRQDGL